MTVRVVVITALLQRMLRAVQECAPLLFFFSTAAQKIMTAKKQAALLASCKSLPNSPTHSGGSTPVSGVFPGQVGPLQTLILALFLFFFLNELSFCWAGQ